MTQICEVVKVGPRGLHRPLRRRRAHAAGDGRRRPGHHLGRVERGARRDGPARRGRRARRLRRRPRDPHAPAAAPPRQLHRVESHPGEGGNGDDGPRRGELPPADGPAEGRDAAEALAASSPRSARRQRGRRGERSRGPRSRLASCSRRGALRGRGGGAARGGASRVRGPARGPLARRGARGRARRVLAHRLARERLGEAGDPARFPPRRARRRLRRPRPLAVLRQGHAAPEAPRRSTTACGSCRAARRCATVPSSARVSSPCRRCTSTSARTWARAR